MELPRATVLSAVIVGIFTLLATLVAGYLNGQRTAERTLAPEIQRQDEKSRNLQDQLQQAATQNQDLSNKLATEERRLQDLSAEVEKLKAAPPELPPPAKPQEEPKPQEQENPVVVSRQFQFALEGCSRSNSPVRVRCRLVVKNLSDDKRPLLFNPMYYMGGRVSYLSDRNGIHYGANVERNAVDNALSPAPELVPNVPAAFSLTFDNVPASLTGAILVIEADEGVLGKNIEVTFPEIQLR